MIDKSKFLEYLATSRAVDELRQPYLDAPNSYERRKIMAAAYQLILPDIKEASKQSLQRWVDPYFLEWDRYATPIEYEAWQCIRSRNVVFYPEYPVLSYFIDFANPILKIGVELDGKTYHDADKDAERDANLSNVGWSIYRIPGSECARAYKDIYQLNDQDGISDEEFAHEMDNWILNTCDGVFEALYWEYFAGDRTSPHSELHAETLDHHRTT